MGTLLVDAYVVLDGLPLSQLDDDGVYWAFSELEGWGSTGSSLDPIRKPRSRGTWSGDAFADGRELMLSGAIKAPTPALLSAALDILIQKASLAQRTLEVIEGGRSRFITVKRVGEVVPTWLNDRALKYTVRFHDDDGRKFGAPVTGSTFLPSSSGGLTVPFTVPYIIASTQVTGQVSIFNPGNTPGPVVLRIDGPVNGPVVTHVGAGTEETWSSSWAGGVGEFLAIDMDARTVLANGQLSASRNGTITSRRWFELDPGPNTFSFTANTYNPASLLTVTAIPSWE